MLKFFRSIRQNLLSENNFNKYLIYAVGEIVLVVIGILIALGINSRVTNYQDISKEKVHLNNLYDDLESIENQLHFENDLLENKVKHNCRFFLETIHLNKEIPSEDALNNAMFGIISLPNNDVIFKAYDNLINTNDLNIIRSNEVKSALSDLAKSIVFQNESVAWQNQQWTTINQPYINKNFEFLDVTPESLGSNFNIPESAFKNDWSIILNDREFRNLVFNRFLAADDVTYALHLLLEKVENCKSLLKQELNNKHNQIL